MKKLFLALMLSALSLTCAQGQLSVFPRFVPFQDNSRLGLLDRDSKVLTPEKPYIHNGYPVFEITVPTGYTEVQVRASLTNFEPGFLLKKDGIFITHYIPTGVFVNGKKEYKALGTYDHPTIPDVNPVTARWNGTIWNFKVGLIGNGLTSADAVEHPWQCTNFTATDGSTYSAVIEYFVYRTCTTGIAADAQWGQGSGDPDPWFYIAKQNATPGDNTEFKRQKWDMATSLTSQLELGGTPGYRIIFQPSRGNLGANEWMQHNGDKLVWIYQVENIGPPPGHPQHPGGADVWNSMVPVEWRNERIKLFSFNASPTITTQPASVTINSGNTATLTVTATGSEPLTYQWYQGAVGTTTTPVGKNYSWFTTSPLNATTTFWVSVTNGIGTVNSSLSTVTVNAP